MDDTATLAVGFAIDPSDSFSTLAQMQKLMDSTEYKTVQSAKNIERATGSMVNVGATTASFNAIGMAASREGKNAAREFARVEKAGESLSRQLDRDIATFGKTRDEIRTMRVEAAALAAEQVGNSERAARLRGQEQALYDAKFAAARRARLETEATAEAEALAAAKAAAAMQAEANAADRLAREHAALVAQVRGSQAAQEADAVAAERLRMSTDPLYAAIKRLNGEIAESTRLYHSGATAPAEYARQQEVLAQRLKAAAEQHDAVAVAGQRNAHSMKMVAVQLPDIVQGLLTGQKPFQVFIQQGGQIAQIGMMAEGGMKGLALQIGRLALIAAPVLAVVGAAAGTAFVAFKKFQGEVKDGGELTRYRDSLGLTRKEMLNLSDGVEKAGGKIKTLTGVTVTASDVMAGLWKTITAQADASKPFDGFKKSASAAFDWVLEAWGKFSAGITAGIRGTFNAVIVTWKSFPAVFGEIIVNGANAAIAALNALVKAGVDQLNGFIATVNLIPGMKIGPISAPQIKPIDNSFAGAAAKQLKDIGDGYANAYARARKEDADFWRQVRANSNQNAKDRMKAEADAIKASRTTKQPKVDRNALNAEATEAQIRNLYNLADAYKVSGAAALIAEARVKAESDAIKKRADIEAMVDRQIRLGIAQRVSDAAKSTATMRDQATAQEHINDMVAAGLAPAQLAADLVKNQIADLSLLHAVNAAQMRADEAAKTKNVARQTEMAAAVEKATAALADQRRERERLADVEKRAAFLVATEQGNQRLAELREELRLIGATDAVRTHALATLRATQEAIKFRPEDRSAYIAQQVEIADFEVQRQLRVDAFNRSLNFQVDLLAEIAANVTEAGRGLADAFGAGGRALGDLTSRLSDYIANRARLRTAHDLEIQKILQIENAEKRAFAERQENALFSARTSAAQIDMFGDMATAAKGFFADGSKGYAALSSAEKAFRAVQFALSVRAMVQDNAATASSIANSVARTAKHAVEAVTKAISSLPFPLNLAAGAATVAALASLGVSVVGSFGGGSKKPEPSNTGTGTVFGDPAAQSASLKNAIDALRQVNTVTNSYARQMSSSLKSIDSQIGNFAAVVVRAGNINASAGVTEGFKSDTTGKLLEGIVTGGGLFTKIPIIGGIIGGVGSLLSSLFGSTTTVIGNGLYGGPQSLGSILSGGFDAQYFSDIEKKKKFFGIVTGRSYSTQYSAADPALENQFALILRSFSDAIKASAGPLGESTAAIVARLNGFVVNIGKIDFKGLTGAQIQEKLTAIFGAAADGMANAAFPGIAQFQKVGEGAFETLVRVASSVEAVTNSLGMLGRNAQGLGVAAKLGLADQFESLSALTDATGAYFQAFYSQEEQAAAKTAQMGKVFESLGLAMPNTLASFRALVEAQDLTTAAGQATYATLLKLSPAFADLQAALSGAKSAADILSERQSLERQLLELQGKTEEIRQLDLAKLDASNRAIQLQIWAIQDAQAAAKAADELRQAWQSVGDSIMDEVKRIRGLSDATGANNFAMLMGQFNAATTAARGGDMDAAKSLPQLSQALLAAAGNAATSRQELARVQAQTAASLEQTYGVIGALGVSASTLSNAALLAASTETAQASTPKANDNAALVALVDKLREEVAGMRSENASGHAATAANTGAIKRKLDDVTQQSGGTAISTVEAA